jgi:hypothetical protein
MEKRRPSSDPFASDYLTRFMKKFLGERHTDPFRIFLLATLVFWGPLPILNFLDRRWLGLTDFNMLQDYASYGQYMIGIPLLIIARDLLNREWTTIHDTIMHSNLL